MGRGQIHPNGSNFKRVAKFDIVSRMRRLVMQDLLGRPRWLTCAERAPPLELHNLKLQDRSIRNPYPQMVGHLLKKYPDLRFQDCFVDGNDWSKGNDSFRDDHPVMQFVAKQLDLMNKGISKKDAFRQTEEHFRERRERLEREQKVLMAMAAETQYAPMFATGHAYWQLKLAENEGRHLKQIRRVLRRKRYEQMEEGERPKETEKPSYLRKREAERDRQQLALEANVGKALPSTATPSSAEESKTQKFPTDEDMTRSLSPPVDDRQPAAAPGDTKPAPTDLPQRSVLPPDTPSEDDAIIVKRKADAKPRPSRSKKETRESSELSRETGATDMYQLRSMLKGGISNDEQGETERWIDARRDRERRRVAEQESRQQDEQDAQDGRDDSGNANPNGKN